MHAGAKGVGDLDVDVQPVATADLPHGQGQGRGVAIGAVVEEGVELAGGLCTGHAGRVLPATAVQELVVERTLGGIKAYQGNTKPNAGWIRPEGWNGEYALLCF